jgi:hypothetical protein
MKSDSPWHLPIKLICADGLSRDYLFLPRVDDTPEKLTWAKLLSTKDLNNGYSQDALHPGNVDRTVVHSGLCNGLEMLKQLMRINMQCIMKPVWCQMFQVKFCLGFLTTILH